MNVSHYLKSLQFFANLTTQPVHIYIIQYIPYKRGGILVFYQSDDITRRLRVLLQLLITQHILHS